MKVLILLSMILVSTATHAGDKISQFTKTLNEDIQDQMKVESYRHGVNLRAPASVQPESVESPIRELNKFEKLDGQKSEANRW
jgi:hypothetical protein